MKIQTYTAFLLVFVLAFSSVALAQEDLDDVALDEFDAVEVAEDVIIDTAVESVVSIEMFKAQGWAINSAEDEVYFMSLVTATVTNSNSDKARDKARMKLGRFKLQIEEDLDESTDDKRVFTVFARDKSTGDDVALDEFDDTALTDEADFADTTDAVLESPKNLIEVGSLIIERSLTIGTFSEWEGTLTIDTTDALDSDSDKEAIVDVFSVTLGAREKEIENVNDYVSKFDEKDFDESSRRVGKGQRGDGIKDDFAESDATDAANNAVTADANPGFFRRIFGFLGGSNN